MMLAWRFPGARGLGVEAEGMSAELARRSLAWNGVAGRCEVRVGDVRDPEVVPEERSFDLVTGTPPYLALGTATVPVRVQQAACHLELRGGIEAYCVAAARLLAPGAPFVVCAARTQEVRVEHAAAAAGLAVERRRDVVPRAGKLPLFAVYALRRAGDASALVVEPPLVVRDQEGRRTAAFRLLRAEMGMPSA
jgi:tRNA1(Val) A37 N6-methylase TrmN6